jgi:hypothetical protein
MGVKPTGCAGGLVIDKLVIEEENLLRLMDLRLQSTQNGKVWGKPTPGQTAFFDLQVNSLQLAAEPYKQSVLYPNQGGNIEKVWIKDFTINGKQVQGADTLPSRLDGPGLIIGNDDLGGQATDISIDLEFPDSTAA